MKISKLILFCLIFVFIFAHITNGQIRSGSAFLKMLPGARLQAMASSHTSMIDDLHAIYANPGAAGFLREWQWSATYTKWISDMYNASLIMGKHLRTPWSHKTPVALGLQYYGVPEFNSTDGETQSTSAHDIVASVSLGQPLSFLSDRISLGSNLKYMRSNLDEFTASSWIADIGLLGRTPRFSLKNQLFRYGILSFGISLTQIGRDLKFDKNGTPLPRTWRFGSSFYAGTHNGMQVQILADYHTVKDEKDAFGLGLEFSWSSRFSLNGGYGTDSDLMNQLSLGIGIRLDDINVPDRMLFPGRNNALRIDLSTVDEGEFFARTYRGTLTHQPIGPEKFRMFEPALGDTITSSETFLKWEKAVDPDLYDLVHYILLHDQDSTKLADIVSRYDNHDMDEFFTLLSSTAVSDLKEESYHLKELKNGHHYWTVIASDLDQHLRFAEINKRIINHFYIPFVDVEIDTIEFHYDPWITQNEYQGNLKVKIKNNGDLPVSQFSFILSDSLFGNYKRIDGTNAKDFRMTFVLVDTLVEFLNRHQSLTFDVPWNTSLLGAHQIIGQVITEKDDANPENNRFDQLCYTIPKGSFLTEDTVTVVTVQQVLLDLPIITDVCFDLNEAEINRAYLHKTVIEPPLKTIADRLCEIRNAKIYLKGFIDINSGEMDFALAQMRSEAVRDSLTKMGVDPLSQVQILKSEITLKRNFKNPASLDAQRVLEELRHVEVTTDDIHRDELFRPIRMSYEVGRKVNQVIFQSDIIHAVPIDSALVSGHQDLGLRVEILAQTTDLKKDIRWDASSLNAGVSYYLRLRDHLNRIFRTVTDHVQLLTSLEVLKNRIAFPLKFSKSEPIYNWNRVFLAINELIQENPKQSLLFEGHACAIGPESFNKKLSQERAIIFREEFEKYIKESNIQLINFRLNDKKQIRNAIGLGESDPLCIKNMVGDIIIVIGDNDGAIGRKLNRRIEAVLSSEPVK